MPGFRFRPPGIARIDGPIQLNEIVVSVGVEPASECRYDAGRYRATQTVRIGERYYTVADPRLMIGKLDTVKVVAAITLSNARSVRRSAPTTLAL